jgi:hypothetical protein
MSGPSDWNPEDGPPPTDDELAESASLRDALNEALRPAPATSASPASSPAPSSAIALVETAMRAHATVHAPSKDSVDRAVRAAVDRAVSPGGASRRGRVLFRLTAAAALVIAGITGLKALDRATPSRSGATGGASISRTADDVFSQALGADPGSDPISRIDDSRMRDFRQGLFARGGRTR